MDVDRDEMDIDRSVIGRWFDAPPFAVEEPRMEAYSRASDVDPPVCRGSAPPVFAAVPIMPAIRLVMTATTTWYEQLRGLHAGHELVVHEPFKPGMTVASRARVEAVCQRRSGVLIRVRTETRSDDGTMLNVQYPSMFYPGGRVEADLGDCGSVQGATVEAPDGEPVAVETAAVAPDQSFRYAGPSGDHGRYHLSEAEAREVGLPGIIVHGLCTLSFAAHGLVRAVGGGDCARLRSLSTRFVKPVLPGQTLTTRIWAMGEGTPGEERFAFETATEDGPVLRAGVAGFAG